MKKILNQSGQIAVILIFFIAVLLAVFAVIANISKLSQQRTAAVVAVDTSASLMASLLASTAEGYFQGVIMGGGERHGRLSRKEDGGTAYYLLDIVLAIAALLIVIFTYGVGTPIGIAMICLAGLSTVASIAVFIIQVAYVAPEMNSMWSKMFRGLPLPDQITQQGIQSLFSASVQDQVLVDDTGDFDMDGYFKGDGTPEGDNEKVGRFSVLYGRRVEWVTGWQNNADKTIAIYAWRDEARPGQPVDSGKWHVVRSQVFAPMRCAGKCGRTSCEISGNSNCDDQGRTVQSGDPSYPGCREPFMPWVKKWEHAVSLHRYWSVIDYVNTDDEGQKKGCCGFGNGSATENTSSYGDAVKCFKGGLVRANLMRYDEGGGTFNWATGGNFWTTIFKNPNAPSTSSSPDDIETVCDLKSSQGWETPDGGKSYALAGSDGKVSAFVINEPSAENGACRNLVKALLRQGFESSSCAEYYCRGGGVTDGSDDQIWYDNGKFGIKLVQCPNRNWTEGEIITIPTGNNTDPCATMTTQALCCNSLSSGCRWYRRWYEIPGDPPQPGFSDVGCFSAPPVGLPGVGSCPATNNDQYDVCHTPPTNASDCPCMCNPY